MIFHRITYTDHKGFVTNEWKHTSTQACNRCEQLVSMGMAPVFFDAVDIPIGDHAKFVDWLHNNPNSPNLAHGEVDGSVKSTYMPLSAEMQALVDRTPARTNQPLVWPEVPEELMKAGALDQARERDARLIAECERRRDEPLAWPPRRDPSDSAVRQAEVPTAGPASALNVQVAGSHYKDKAIQPVEYMHANGIPFIEGSVIKYMTRWRDKGGVKDLEKAKHFIELLIELEQRATKKE